MRAHFLLPILVIILLPIAGFASPRDHLQRWLVRCEALLERFVLRRESYPRAVPDLRAEYNRKTLRRGHALMISPGAHGLTVLDRGEPEWVSAVTRAAVESVLDRNLPFWREDGDWYFQSAEVIRLHTLSSASPLAFERETWLLMSGNFVRAEIVLRPQPALDLFD